MEKPELTSFHPRGCPIKQQPPKVKSTPKATKLEFQRLGEGKFDDELQALEAQRNELFASLPPHMKAGLLDEMMLELGKLGASGTLQDQFEAIQTEKKVLPDGSATQGSRPFTPPASDQQPSPINGIDLGSPSPPPAQSSPDIQGFHMMRTAQPLTVPEQRSPRRSPTDFPVGHLNQFPTHNAPKCSVKEKKKVRATENLRQQLNKERSERFNASSASKSSGLVLPSSTHGQLPQSKQQNHQDFATNIPTSSPPGVAPTSCIFPSLAGGSTPRPSHGGSHGGGPLNQYPHQGHNAVPIPTFAPRLPFLERK